MVKVIPQLRLALVALEEVVQTVRLAVQLRAVLEQLIKVLQVV
tara:strand:- start:422 stop:550 length:129 start_codon:yes stop_codon:yes gene_type:complete